MLKNSKFKPQFSGHETFPLRQLWPKKVYDGYIELRDSNSDLSNLFTEKSIPIFGVGKNMVTSMKHWALACNILIESPNKAYELGFTGKVLFENKLDEYLEYIDSAWLIHWQLCGIATRSTSWSWLFNYIGFQPFNRIDVLTLFKQLASDMNLKVSDTTLKRDIDVCLRCYAPKYNYKDIEDSLDPLLIDLNLVKELQNGSFQILGGDQPSLSNEIFTFALIEYWQNLQQTSATLSFESIAHGIGSPGRIFKLSESSISERLILIDEITDNALSWVDSSGVKQVVKKSNDIFNDSYKSKIIKKAYVK
jgi:hypothetical protein